MISKQIGIWACYCLAAILTFFSVLFVLFIYRFFSYSRISTISPAVSLSSFSLSYHATDLLLRSLSIFIVLGTLIFSQISSHYRVLRSSMILQVFCTFFCVQESHSFIFHIFSHKLPSLLETKLRSLPSSTLSQKVNFLNCWFWTNFKHSFKWKIQK